MSDLSKIEWCDSTWNVLVGCEKVSPGCDNCYAIRTAHRMQANPNAKVAMAYAGTETGMEWTGRVNLIEDRLSIPLRWKRPRRIFVNAQSDLFHKDVPDEFIARVWAVMAATPHHTYQVLTKRHARMRSLLSSPEFDVAVADAWTDLGTRSGETDEDHTPPYPLPNVHLGVSAEDQHWADIRIPALLETPAAVRWVSAEPLLGPIDMSESTGWLLPGPDCPCESGEPYCHPTLDWLVVGGESGPGARPMHPQWARDLRDQCEEAGVPFLYKQHGEWTSGPSGTHRVTYSGAFYPNTGGCLMSNEELVTRVGKRAAGRVLDGRTWDEYPVVSS